MSKVLVVDDEANVAKSVRRLLEASGFSVITAEDGKNALEIMRAEDDISVIVSDQRMPKMTGSELFAQLSIEHPDIKRILLTGYTDLDSIRAAVNQGNIFRFLLKPWDDDELLKVVEEGEHYYLVKRENDRLRSELELANLNLENKIEQKTRVLNMNIRSLQRYEKIVETLPVGLLCVSDDGMVVLSNTKFCHLFEFSSAVEGMPFKRVLPSGLHPAIDNFQAGSQVTYQHKEESLSVISSALEIEKSIFGKLLVFIVNHES
jgi:YesN/AraC family two-component response regulator